MTDHRQVREKEIESIEIASCVSFTGKYFLSFSFDECKLLSNYNFETDRKNWKIKDNFSIYYKDKEDRF